MFFHGHLEGEGETRGIRQWENTKNGLDKKVGKCDLEGS